MDNKKRVTRKLVHWELFACSRQKEEMIQLEEERKLSFSEMKRISNKPCIQCKMCTGQQTLEEWI